MLLGSSVVGAFMGCVPVRRYQRSELRVQPPFSLLAVGDIIYAIVATQVAGAPKGVCISDPEGHCPGKPNPHALCARKNQCTTRAHHGAAANDLGGQPFIRHPCKGVGSPKA